MGKGEIYKCEGKFQAKLMWQSLEILYDNGFLKELHEERLPQKYDL